MGPAKRRSVAAQTPWWLHFADAHRAEEWCEDQLLSQMNAATDDQPVDLSQQHLCEGLSEEEFCRLESLRRLRPVSAGKRVVLHRDEAESKLFVLAGELEVVVDADKLKQLRLKTFGPGRVLTRWR